MQGHMGVKQGYVGSMRAIDNHMGNAMDTVIILGFQGLCNEETN